MRALIVGFDSFDPKTYQILDGQGKTPNLRKLSAMGGFSPLRVSNPPQTEVSWTSIATGADPGEHGIFDFVHRDPATYTPFVSILVTKKSAAGIQYVRPYNAHTIFDEAVEQGYPATALWWPALFPVSPESGVQVLPGLGTPDIKGQLGVGTFLSEMDNPLKPMAKTKVGKLERNGSELTGKLEGPMIQTKNGPASASILVSISRENNNLVLNVSDRSFQLEFGVWSDIIELKFKAGFLMNIHAITRAIVTSLDPFQVYFVPIQIHPLHSPWRYGTPGSFVKDVWNSSGKFLTLGWPQDTNGLEDDCITDEQFLCLCEDIFATREKILFDQLEKFKEGVLASIFDDLDRIQHMFLRRNTAVIEEWYLKLDAFVGRILDWIARDTGKALHFLVLSDHGFAKYETQFHLNKWLIDNGYMRLLPESGGRDLESVDWANTTAYAVGLNSLYVNLRGREGQGCVDVMDVEAITGRLKADLAVVKTPEGKPVFSNVYLRHEAFSGPNLAYGPDLVLGYAPGFRASSDTGLGKWGEAMMEPNLGHWEADHCIDHQAVPGVIFSNKSLDDFPSPTFRDIPAMVVGKYFEHSGTNPPVISSGEDKKTMEERLKGLGYL